MFSDKEYKAQAFEGYETWFNAFRMSAKMYSQVFFAFVLLHVLLGFAAAYLYLGDYACMTTARWLVAKPTSAINPNANMRWVTPEGKEYFTTASSIAETPSIETYARDNLKKALFIFLGCGLMYLLMPLGLRGFKRRAKHQAAKSYIRGARLIDKSEFKKIVKQEKIKLDLPFGDVRMPVDAETRHTFIIGRPGTGKTVCLTQVLERLKERKSKGVVYDFKGEYLSRFYDPDRDFIFNPLDTRSAGWNLFNELENYMDVDSIAQSLIPHSISATDPFWNDAARGVFSGILHYLYQTDKKDNRELWHMLTLDGNNISKALKDTFGAEAGHRYIEDSSSKQALSVLAVMMQYTKCFEYMSKVEGDFSIKNWLSNDDAGFIFITNYADIQDTLRPILSLFLDLLGRKVLSLSENFHRRIFFLIDEFGTLQRLSTMLKLLTLSRSKGGSVLLGIQDVGQVDQIYGKNHRQSIVNACGNQVIFAVEDTDTASYCSEKISDIEYEEAEKSYSMGPSDYRDGVTIAMRKKKERLFLPSEIKSLKELTGILKFTNHPYLISDWNYKAYRENQTAFILREDLSLDAIIKEQTEIQERVKKIKAQIEAD